MLIPWGLISIKTLNNHPSRKTGGPLRLAKTVFERDKHPFRDVNEKIGANSMFEMQWYGMPTVRLNMEMTCYDSYLDKTACEAPYTHLASRVKTPGATIQDQ